MRRSMPVKTWRHREEFRLRELTDAPHTVEWGMTNNKCKMMGNVNEE